MSLWLVGYVGRASLVLGVWRHVAGAVQEGTNHRDKGFVWLYCGSAAQDNVMASADCSVTGFCAINAEDGCSAAQ